MTTTSKLFIVNMAGACVVAWAFFMGYAQALHAADASHIGYVLVAVFLSGCVGSFWLAHELDGFNKHVLVSYSRRVLDRNVIYTGYLHYATMALFILGIIGNAIGFRIAFSGLSLADISSAEGIRKAGAQLLPGIGTALGATIVGLTLALWTMANTTIIEVAQKRLAGGATKAMA